LVGQLKHDIDKRDIAIAQNMLDPYDHKEENLNEGEF
jgi:hypothetical protein